jgi:hypothetical protein
MRRNWAYGLALKLARLHMDRSGQRRSFAGSQLEEFTSVLEAAHVCTNSFPLLSVLPLNEYSRKERWT